MKAYKIITIITIIILIGILGVAAFGGVYKLKDYKVKNVIPNNLFGKEFSKSRTVELTVDDSVKSTTIYDKDGNEVTEKNDETEYTIENGYTTIETKVNPDESLTKENYEKSKQIILKRIKNLNIEQYTIKQNKENGNITLDITQNDNTDENIANLISKGTFEIVDSQTQEVLLNNNNIKSASVVYGQVDNTNTVVYLQVKFNKEGAKKLEEISKTYIETTVETTNEEGEKEETKEAKEVSLLLDGEEIKKTHFGDTLTGGILNIPISSASDSKTLQTYMNAAGEIAILLNNGVMPISYVETDYIKDNSINIFENKLVVYSVIVIAILAFVYMIIKLKVKGILAGLLEIGYISLLLLVIRYTSTIITVEGIIGIALSIIINYVYIFKAFNKLNLKFVKELTANFALKLIPVYIIAIVFTFGTTANVTSFGMTLVWGLIIMYLYNLSVTQISTRTIQK